MNFQNSPFFQCSSEVSACTPLCRRFNSILDQHFLSWLEAYPWTKLEMALTWLTLLLHYNGLDGPCWWHRISSSSDWSNPGISWLWNFHYNAEWACRRQFVHFLLAFLRCPKRCRHLSVGKALTTGHFAYLCVRTVLDCCLGSTDLPKLRYLLCSFSLTYR